MKKLFYLAIALLCLSELPSQAYCQVTFDSRGNRFTRCFVNNNIGRGFNTGWGFNNNRFFNLNTFNNRNRGCRRNFRRGYYNSARSLFNFISFGNRF